MRIAALLVFVMLLSCRPRETQSREAQDKETMNRETRPSNAKPAVTPCTNAAAADPKPATSTQATSTQMLARHVIFYENSGLQLRVRWLRGRMYPTKTGTNPSFDQPDSFKCEIQDGVVGVDTANFASVLNSYVFKNSPLHDVKLSGLGQQVKVSGTLKKGVPLPVQMIGELNTSSDGRIHIHVNKISVLKIPLKAVLKDLHLKTENLFDAKGVTGFEINQDDIYIDPSKVTPPPRHYGKLSQVTITKDGELLETYGRPNQDLVRVPWRNFLSLKGGTVEFGKLTMRDADLLMIDTSQSDWFRFDTARYEEQLVNGYAHITPSAGLQMFVPDITKIPSTKANRDISVQWVKNLNPSAPAAMPKPEAPKQ